MADCQRALTEYSIAATKVTVRVVEGDIGRSVTDGVINAANEASFTPMDGGISGALRAACAPDDVIGKEKIIYSDECFEVPSKSKRVGICHAGAQSAAGKLEAQGVKWIIHAVGPRWSDHPPTEEVFATVRPQIRETVVRALRCADRVGCVSVTVPALSGGIFTHHGVPPSFKQREQVAAREELIAGISSYCAGAAKHERESGASTSHLREIVLIDLPASHPMSCVGLLLAAADGAASWTLKAPEREAACAASSGETTTLKRGAHVLIHSLQAKPHLNRTFGLILSYEAEKGRYAVRTATGATMLLKPANLTKMRQAEAESAASAPAVRTTVEAVAAKEDVVSSTVETAAVKEEVWPAVRLIFGAVLSAIVALVLATMFRTELGQLPLSASLGTSDPLPLEVSTPCIPDPPRPEEVTSA